MSRIEEKIKQIEPILRMKAAEEYDARVFLDKLCRETDNPHVLCKAIIDEMDRGKEIVEKIFAEI